MMATANQKCREYAINRIHTMAAKSLQQQSPSFPAKKLKINDRVSSVHVDSYK